MGDFFSLFLLLGSFNLETHVLQFWEIFSHYFFDFSPPSSQPLSLFLSLVSVSGNPVWMMEFHDWPSGFSTFSLLFSSLFSFQEDFFQSFYWGFHLCNYTFNLLEIFVSWIYLFVSCYFGFLDTIYFILLRMLRISLDGFLSSQIFSVPSNFSFLCSHIRSWTSIHFPFKNETLKKKIGSEEVTAVLTVACSDWAVPKRILNVSNIKSSLLDQSAFWKDTLVLSLFLLFKILNIINYFQEFHTVNWVLLSYSHC